MIYHSKMSLEIEIEIIIPAGARLIGTRTKGNKVIAVQPKIQQPRPNRPIGFAIYDTRQK